MDAEHPAATPGGLYVVATPIGNLEDITLRALRILQEVSLVLAEDTRHTGRLLSHHGLKCRLLSCHEYNQHHRTSLILEKLARGESVALVTDAGTPGISDPGYVLVQAARRARHAVIPIPGASAAVTALSVAGLPSNAFHFIGFPPTPGGRRRRQLEVLTAVDATLIFYESPRRLLRLLQELQIVLGDRPAFLAREMTKRHEEYLYGQLSELYHQLANRDTIRGECTLLVGGYTTAGDSTMPLATTAAMLQELQVGLDANERPGALSARIAARYGLSRKEVYQMIIERKQGVNPHGNHAHHISGK